MKKDRSMPRLCILALFSLIVLLLACARAAPTATPAPTLAPTATQAPPARTPTAAPVAATPTSVAATPTRVVAVAPTATAIAVAKRKPTGTINILLPTFESERWLPRDSRAESYVMAPMYESLFFEDPGTRSPVPGPATEWKAELKPGGKVDWTIKLRKGVQFHKGWGEMKADDVKFSITEFGRPGSRNSRAADVANWYGKDPKNIEIINDYELVVHSPGIDVSVEESALVEGVVKILPKSYMEKMGEEEFAKNPVFSGPYEFIEHKRAQYVKMKALEEHWRVVPEFLEINMLLVPESTTQMALMRTGKGDVAELDLALKKEADAAGLRLTSLKMQTGADGFFGGIWLKSHPKYDPTIPWVGQDPLDPGPTMVRQAMNLAVDRQAIVSSILLGEGADTNTGWYSFTPGAAWTNPELKPLPYDPKKAKELLAQAGYPNGFTFGVWILTNFIQEANITEAATSNWEAIGLKPQRRRIEYRPTVREKLIARETGGWVYVFPNTTNQTPWSHSCTVGGMSTSTIHHFEHPVMDELCSKMRGELDFGKRAATARQLHEFLYKNYLMWPVAFYNQIFMLSSKIDWVPAAANRRWEYAKHRQ